MSFSKRGQLGKLFLKVKQAGFQKSQTKIDLNPVISKPSDKPPQPENKSIKVGILSFSFAIKNATDI